MITQSFINEKLKDFNYYVSKLPMYLRESYGFVSHFRIWYDALYGEVENGEILLNLLNIFDDDYLNYLKDIDNNDILDKIGLLYGATRNVAVEYLYNGQLNKENLQLNNNEFLTYIKSRIVQNYCDGTLKQILDYYNSIKANSIYVINNPDASASAKLYLIKNITEELNNIDKLFLAGKLKIESMGIVYSYEFLDIQHVGVWNVINNENTNGWGVTASNEGGLWAQ